MTTLPRRRSRLLTFAVSAAAAALAAQAGAQNAGLAPIEVMTCDFADGKGRADLDMLAAGFNEWMRTRDAPPYAAYALFPQAHAPPIDFDLAWVGAWPDGATMGASMEHYFAQGGELAPLFDSVMTCRDNRNFAVLTLQDPQAPGRFGPLEVSDCTLPIGGGAEPAVDAIRAWIDRAARAGSTAAHWLLFPAYGERAEARYAFKWAIGYGSYEDFGRDYDRFTSGGGAEDLGELLDGVLRCDSPRLYSVRAIRIEDTASR